MIHTFSFYPIDSRMYIIIEGKQAVVVDPCVSDEALKLLQEQSVTEILVLLTHEHYDHISGVNWLRQNISKVHVLCSQKCALALSNPTKNLSVFWEILFTGKDAETQEYIRKMNIQPYSCDADETFEGTFELKWQGHILLLTETPGHSKGSICILLDGTTLFSGDTLVTGFPIVLRLPGGSKKDYKESTLPYLDALDPAIMVYPGHGDKQVLEDYNYTL